MAPRSRALAAQQSATAAPAVRITELPESVLAKCLAHLDLKQRLGPVSLACKAFAAAAHSPELLREMDVVLPNLPAVRSFAAFLARHGQQLQRLTLRCKKGTAEDEAAALAATIACLSAGGAGGQMEGLSASGCIPSTDWPAAMPAVRRLRLELQHAELRISPALSTLTSLSDLDVTARVTFPAGLRLPPSLERLTVGWDGSAGLAEQVAQLPRLSSLCLDSCSYTPASLGALSRLSGSLTHLQLVGACVPATLSTLTNLQSLSLWDSRPPEEGDEAVLSGALPHLRQLSRLILETEDHAVPAALVSLSNLQRCYLEVQTDEAAAPPLPAGPWLASLRWLSYPICGLVSSTAALRDAAALEYLETINSWVAVFERESDPAADFFGWLAQHPPLRRVHLEDRGRQAYHTPVFADYVTRLGRRRPSLVLEEADVAGMFDLLHEE